MRPLLIGEAPARTTPAGWPPFYGAQRSGRILWELGFRVARAPDRPGNVDAINLLDEWPGRRWPKEIARDAADRMMKTATLVEREHVVLVGRNVAEAFGVTTLDWFEWIESESFRLTVMPHPSPLNRWWNDERNRIRARNWTTQLLSRTTNVARMFRMPRRVT